MSGNLAVIFMKIIIIIITIIIIIIITIIIKTFYIAYISINP